MESLYLALSRPELQRLAEEDVVVILCGPKGFVDDVCQPLLRELKYRNVLTMW